MKKLLILAILSCCTILSCKNNTTANDHTDYLLLKEQVVVLQNRIDSLIQVMNEKQRPVVSQKQKKAKSNNKGKNTSSSLTSESNNNNQKNYNWETTQTNTIPTYKPKKESQAYEVRVGAICCDGSRSYATGRGACSHHGGVCKWLYK